MFERAHGRAADALRPVHIERGYTKYAPGSVLIAFGDTRVLCTAFAEDSVPPFLRDSGKGWLTAEYAMLPSSTHDRGRRDGYQKGRAKEISRLIGRSLRAAVDLEALGERQITIDCDVLQADGGTRTAAITGAFVAVHDALQRLVAQGQLDRPPIRHFCAAVSAGLVAGTPLLDLEYREDAQADMDLNVVMTETGTLVDVQGGAEGATLSRAELDALLDMAQGGIGRLIEMQRLALGLA